MADAATIALYASHLLGVLAVTFGARQMLDPVGGANHFLGSTTQTSQTASLMPLVGARVVATGLALLILGYQGNTEAVGVVAGCTSLIGGADLWVVWKSRGKGLVTHAVGTAVWVAIALGLLMK